MEVMFFFDGKVHIRLSNWDLGFELSGAEVEETV